MLLFMKIPQTEIILMLEGTDDKKKIGELLL